MFQVYPELSTRTIGQKELQQLASVTDFHVFGGIFIAPDKAAYCVFTQFPGPENAIRFISVHTKTQ